ncbi:para-nitrobenzyl esterase [Fusarium circinatum]|uniref:Carboxylic ester hydrolase n=1 Tax=Fusarium circinatum TaxID=48490 RepID=A0A8H5TNN1_FUSCI|nr:para-nitrobenzyl esterase [Fusarium circinatum]
MRPFRYLMLLECLLLGSLALPQSNIPSLDARDASPSVSLEQGTIVGTATIVNAASPTVHKFLGVPFAESPPKRFAPPEPVKKSKDKILAQKWSPKCIENAAPGPLVDDAEQSEDCLYLNVYVPDTATSNKAVMFWIYGGDLQFGNAGQPNYDGSPFAASQDVIVVSANYRTNAFGFSNSPEIPARQRNSGFLDQRLALQWVQENIQAFGGDPKKVTIFGESSGASSVDRLLTAPPSPLPYRAAILQSGQASVSVASGGDGPASWRSLVKLLGCDGSASELDCVRKADALKIRSLVMDKGLVFTPINDGVTQLATPQIISRSSGHAAPVPMLIGSNGLEASLFLQPLFKELYESKSANATYEGLAGLLGDQAAGFIRKEVVSKTSKGAVALFYALSQVASDILCKCPASLVSKASASAGNPTWRYLFNGTYPNTQAPLILPEYGLTSVGAFHSSEIPIVFGTYGEFDKYAPSTADEIALTRKKHSSVANGQYYIPDRGQQGDNHIAHERATARFDLSFTDISGCLTVHDSESCLCYAIERSPSVEVGRRERPPLDHSDGLFSPGQEIRLDDDGYVALDALSPHPRLSPSSIRRSQSYPSLILDGDGPCPPEEEEETSQSTAQRAQKQLQDPTAQLTDDVLNLLLQHITRTWYVTLLVAWLR